MNAAPGIPQQACAPFVRGSEDTKYRAWGRT
ncbi:hypothetical protein BSY15_3653 [Acidovorax sp. RAC01]|nr:hypothetical protein BSY15_3653 [Acidovorax sp. RAC01]